MRMGGGTKQQHEQRQHSDYVEEPRINLVERRRQFTSCPSAAAEADTIIGYKPPPLTLSYVLINKEELVAMRRLKEMASSDVSNRGEPLQIIRITSKENDDGEITHGLELVDENLEKIMLHPEVKENPVVIISITGAFRKGKSFLLGFFLKFLETQPEECDWLSEDDKIEGFEWRGGSDRVTSGILIWSEPFIRENKFGEKKFIFLIRDWSFPYENAYGKDGGNAYIRKKLKIKKSQHNEQKNIRRNLEKCFPNIGGFLLPYPGKAIVTNQAYNGLVKELDGDFVENVKLLIPYILSKEMLVARQINNTDVTGQYLLKYVKVGTKYRTY
uniref:Atlastin-1 n=1 Tax=Magallana gigas TaxID=29159 RepID=K1QDH5_MAGGI